MAKLVLALPGEVWKPLPLNPDQYHVSSLGRICNVRRGRLLSQGHINHGGYRSVSIHRDGKQKTRPVHVLVCMTFHGPRPDGLQAAHNNGDRQDNRAENLRWATPWENSQDRLWHGTAPRGSDHKRAKLDERAVYALRLLTLGRCVNRTLLAQALGVSRKTMNQAISGAKWAHVPLPEESAFG